MNYLFVENGFFVLPAIVFLVGVIRMGGAYYMELYTKSKKSLREIKMNEKEEKRSLISKMDPVVVETLREIVMADMKKEFEEMRNSDQGCSQKCMMIKSIADKDLERHKAVVKKLFDFEWCDFCSGGGPDAASVQSNGKCPKPMCMKGCGP